MQVFFLSRETMKNGTWIYLDVLAPPHFRSKPPEILYVKVGESLVLPCKADGKFHQAASDSARKVAAATITSRGRHKA